MGFRKVSIRQSAADSIAEISWYLESEGMLATAEKFTDNANDLFSNSAIVERDTAHAGTRFAKRWDTNAFLTKKSTR